MIARDLCLKAPLLDFSVPVWRAWKAFDAGYRYLPVASENAVVGVLFRNQVCRIPANSLSTDFTVLDFLDRSFLLFMEKDPVEFVVQRSKDFKDLTGLIVVSLEGRYSGIIDHEDLDRFLEKEDKWKSL